MPQAVRFGADYLQNLIDREITLAKHMAVVVESADDASMILRAPLAPNANHKGTAFGGSLYALAVLTGWAWVTRSLATHEIDAEAVIQQSSMRFLVPVHGELRASIEVPAATAVDKFHRMLKRSGRGRIRLQVHMHDGHALATEFDGLFAAAMRRWEEK